MPEKNPPRHHVSENHIPEPRNPEPPRPPKPKARKVKPAPRSETAKTAPVVKKEPLTFTQYTEKYLAARAVVDSTVKRIRGRVRSFIEWLGEDILIRDVTCELVNEYIIALQSTTELSSTSVNGYRADLRCVWFEAYTDGYNEHPPLRLRRVPKLREAIEAFTHEEIGKLLKATEKFPQFYRNGIKRADFWRAVILAGYSTGGRDGHRLQPYPPLSG